MLKLPLIRASKLTVAGREVFPGTASKVIGVARYPNDDAVKPHAQHPQVH
jgi:hypothetical protein